MVGGGSSGGGGGGGERMFDLQEFLARESGNVRQSITEVDESEQPLSSQTATEFPSQGSGISSQGLSSQGLSLSQHSDAKSAVELNMSANSNTNNNNDNYCDGSTSLGGGVGGYSESILSMEDILAEFDVGMGPTVPSVYTSQRDEENRLALLPCDNSTTTIQPPRVPPASNLPIPHEELTTNLSVHHQRQHSRSFNSGLNRLAVASNPGRPKLSLALSKSVSTDVLSDTGTTEAGVKKGRKGKDKVLKGGGSKKKRYGGSFEAISGDRTSRKPPSGKPRKNKLPLEPRGPLYGGRDVELYRHSAFVDSSHLSMLTNVHHPSREADGGVGEGGKRRSSHPFTEDDESFSLEDFQHQQSSGAHDESVWQEYGQI